jgi:hypothetical protein
MVHGGGETELPDVVEADLRRLASRAPWIAGSSITAIRPMIAITTSSSTSVRPG